MGQQQRDQVEKGPSLTGGGAPPPRPPPPPTAQAAACERLRAQFSAAPPRPALTRPLPPSPWDSGAKLHVLGRQCVAGAAGGGELPGGQQWPHKA